MAKKPIKRSAAKKRRTTAGVFTPNGDPPGATKRAANRPLDPGGGSPGSGAGPRHAADDEGTEDEEYFRTDITRTPASPPEEEEDSLEQGPPYAGISGGAVGGTPAQGRAVGGRTGHEINYDEPPRGDSTIGSNAPRGRPQKTTKRSTAPRGRKRSK